MRTHLAKGFTLVEILIVVVILGILAAIVVPQFTDASQDAIKSALRSQMQTISAQVELYRVQNAGTLPDITTNWDLLVDNDYLKNEPVNGYTGSSVVTDGDGSDLGPVGAAVDTTGWVYNYNTGNGDGDVFAYQYDPVNNLLSNETDYDNNVTD